MSSAYPTAIKTRVRSRSWLGLAIQGLLRRWRAGWRGLLHISALALALFLSSGFSRGQAIDGVVGTALSRLVTTVRDGLADGWMAPVIANAAVAMTTYALFAIALLLMAMLVRRVPAFVGFLILSELNRRQGRSICALELLLGLSLPLAMAIAWTEHGIVSLLAVVHFVLAYSYLRLSNHPKRVDSILNWYVRVRTSMDSAADDSDADDVDEED